MSACEKYKQHRGQAQKALLKHLLVTGPSMRLRYYMLDFKRSQKKVSACKKYQQHRGQAQQALLKHLLVTASSMRLQSAKTHRAHVKSINNIGVRPQKCKKMQKNAKNTKNAKKCKKNENASQKITSGSDPKGTP